MTQLQQALDDLGSTVGEITDTLLQLGVTGVPGSTTECPIARYLNSRFPGAQFDITGADIWDRNDTVPVVMAPPAVTAFIMTLDYGGVPELVDCATPELVDCATP